MTHSIAYQQLAAIKLPLVNKFYQEVKARGKASGGDSVWVARDITTSQAAAPIIAAARLSPIRNVYWLLTGVYVAASYRNQGIAAQLITKLVSQHDCCYTFALVHLFEFYNTIGFTKVSVDELPCELAQRFCAYQHQGRNIVAMIRK